MAVGMSTDGIKEAVVNTSAKNGSKCTLFPLEPHILHSVEECDKKETDVIFAYKELPDPKLVEKAQRLMLPLYEKKPECSGCRGCEPEELDVSMPIESSNPASKDRQAGLLPSVSPPISSKPRLRATPFSSSGLIGSTNQSEKDCRLFIPGKRKAAIEKGSQQLKEKTELKRQEHGTGDFKPIVMSPNKSSQNGEVLFVDHCKLFHFSKRMKRWEECGVGNIKIMQDQPGGKFRIIMHQDTLLKVCCNHYITGDMKLLPLNNYKSWTWFTQCDLPDEKAKKLFVRFEEPEAARTFKEVFDRCTREASIVHVTFPPSLPMSLPFELCEEPVSERLGSTVAHEEHPAKMSKFTEQPLSDREEKIPQASELTKQKLASPQLLSEAQSKHQLDPLMVTQPTQERELAGQQPASPPATCEKLAESVSETIEEQADLPVVNCEKEPTQESVLPKEQRSPLDTCEEQEVPVSKTMIAEQFNLTVMDHEKEPIQGFESSSGPTQRSFFPMESFPDIIAHQNKAKINLSMTTGFQFQGTGQQLLSPAQEFDSENPEHETDVFFKPIVTLPDDYTYKSSDNDTEVLFSHRCKLFHFDEALTQWKERGVGDLKIMQHEQSGKSRVIMRRDQILKVCCNHYITEDMKLLPLNNDRCWTWFTQCDLSEEEAKAEKVAVRFRAAETAKKFKEVFDECTKEASTTHVTLSSGLPLSKSSLAIGFGEQKGETVSKQLKSAVAHEEHPAQMPDFADQLPALLQPLLELQSEDQLNSLSEEQVTQIPELLEQQPAITETIPDALRKDLSDNNCEQDSLIAQTSLLAGSLIKVCQESSDSYSSRSSSPNSCSSQTATDSDSDNQHDVNCL